jgi:hypothetical protein
MERILTFVPGLLVGNTLSDKMTETYNSLLGQYPEGYIEVAFTRHTGFNGWLTTADRDYNPSRDVLMNVAGEDMIDAMQNLTDFKGDVTADLALLSGEVTELLEEYPYLYMVLHANPYQGWQLKLSNQTDKEHFQYKHFFSVSALTLDGVLALGVKAIQWVGNDVMNRVFDAKELGSDLTTSLTELGFQPFPDEHPSSDYRCLIRPDKDGGDSVKLLNIGLNFDWEKRELRVLFGADLLDEWQYVCFVVVDDDGFSERLNNCIEYLTSPSDGHDEDEGSEHDRSFIAPEDREAAHVYILDVMAKVMPLFGINHK